MDVPACRSRHAAFSLPPLGHELPLRAVAPSASLAHRLHGSMTQSDLEGAADILRSYYRCARVEFEHDRLQGHRSSSMVRQVLLPPHWHHPTQLDRHPTLFPPPVTAPVPLVLDMHRNCVSVPLFGGDGAASFLVGGVPGSGKTMTLRTLLAGLAPTAATIVAIDPSGGAESIRWAQRLAASVSLAEPGDTIDLLVEVLDLIHRRGRLLGSGGTVALHNPVVLVCDELAELAAAGMPKQQEGPLPPSPYRGARSKGERCFRPGHPTHDRYEHRRDHPRSGRLAPGTRPS